MASISFFVTGIPGDEEKRAGMALQYPLLSAGASNVMLLFIHSVIYKQNFIKTGREWNFIDIAPLSSCFYEYLFRDFCDGRSEKNVQTG